MTVLQTSPRDSATEIPTGSGGSRSRRAIAAAVIGNGLEIYDFTVYSFFAVAIGRLFYPNESAFASLMLSFATFAVGFVVRPLGAVLIGHVGDRKGRKAALTLTISLMTAGTAMIAVIPTYSQIGIAASFLLLTGRLLQGLSAGGEIGAASALLMESSDRSQRCYFISWQGASQGAAALLGALVGVGLTQALSPQDLESWGWRVPFLVGLLIAPVGMYIRRNLVETTTAGDRSRANLRLLVSTQWSTLLLGTLLMAGSTGSMYIMVFYMPTFLVRSLGMPPMTAFLAACLAGIVLLVVSPLGGKLADRLGHRKPLIALVIICSLVATFPGIRLLTLSPGLASVLVVVGVSAALSALTGGAGGALMMEALPKSQRAAGMSMMYSFGVTIFGGFAPLVVTWLISVIGTSAPALYLFMCLSVSLSALGLFPSSKWDVE